MAEFGPQATDLSAPTGAGAVVTGGVTSSSYTPDLSPIANLVKGGMDLFQQFKKADEGKADNLIISGVSKELGDAEQEFLQTQDLNKYMVRKSSILRRAQTSSPHLLNEIKNLAGLSKEGVGGVAEDEFAAERKRDQKILSDASEDGFIIPKDPKARGAIIDAFLTTRRIAKETEEYRKAVRFEGEQDSIERAARQEREKETSVQNLVTIAGKHAIAFNEGLYDLAKQVQAGLDPAEAMVKAQTNYQLVMGQINAVSARDPSFAAPFREQFNTIFNTWKESFKPGSDVLEMENKFKKMKLKADIDVAGDYQLLKLSSLSNLLRNQPQVTIGANSLVAKTLIGWGVIQDGRMSPKDAPPETPIVGNQAHEKQAYPVIQKSIKSYLDGGLDVQAKKDIKGEVFGQVKGIVNQYVEQYQLRKLDSESRGNMTKFLLDKDTARFLKENPLPVSLARGLSKVVEDNFSQYEKTLINALPDSVLGKTKKDDRYNMAPAAAAGAPEAVSRGPAVDPLAAIDITWERDRMVFTPKKMPVDIIDQNKLVADLNRVSEALSNGVIVGAHVEGTDNYKQYFDKVKHRLFESKFPAPDAPKEEKKEGDYSKEKNLKSIVGEGPNGLTDDLNKEPSKAYNIKTIRQELKKATNKEQIDALLEALDNELNRRD